MADSNLPNLSELNETPATDDLLYIVDTSDTTDGVTGTNKKITRSNLVGGLQAQPAEGAFVDGDKTKLDGIETGADVTDATNVDSAGAVMESDVDAKGDIFVATADNTVTRLPVGTNDQVLTADSAEASGVKWADASGGGGGQTLYDAVLDASGGGDYTDFSTALSALTAGQTLFIRSGTYTEATAFDITTDGITLIGENPYNTKIVMSDSTASSWNGANWTVQNLQFENSGGAFFTFNTSDSVFDNCIFTASTTAGIYVFGFTADGTKISNCLFDTTYATEQARVQRFQGNMRIANCTFKYANGSNSTTLGCAYFNDTDITITNCFFDVTAQTTTNGVLVHLPAGGTFTNNRIDAVNNKTRGVYGGSFSVVSSNSIFNCLTGVYIGGQYCTINNNIINNASGNTGVFAVDVSQNHNTIVGNIFRLGNNAVGADLNATDYNTVVGNVIQSATTGVITTTGGDNNVVIGNAFSSVTTDFNDGGTGNLSVTATDSDPLNTT